MASSSSTARLRQAGVFSPHQHQQPVDANTLFTSKASLAPPSSSSFLSTWQQHSGSSSASSSPSSPYDAFSSSLFQSDDQLGSAREQVELELPVGKREKSDELADAVLLQPPRRSNDPMFQTIPLRTQSTASPPQQHATHSTLTSYASAPGKRQLDEGFISSSQPLPSSERWNEDDEPMVQSPATTKRKTNHLTPPKSHNVATPRSPLPSDSAVSMGLPTVSEAADPVIDSSNDVDVPLAASTSPSVAEVSSDSSAETMLSSLQLLSPHMYELSQYHLMLGVCLMRDGDLSEASREFAQADQLFQPAVDLLPEAAFSEHKSDLLSATAKATGEAALKLQAGAGEGVEGESARSEREEKARVGLQKARELYSAAIDTDGGTRAELWNDLCMFLLRVGDLQAAGQLLELLVGACGDCLDLFVNLGVLHTVYGDAEAASDYFQHVLARSPQHVTALVNYAATLSARQQHKAALRVLTLAHQLHPRSVLVMNNAAVECGLTGDHLAAAAWLQKADEVGYESERVATVSLSFNTANQMLALACVQSDAEVRNKLLDGADALLTFELAREKPDRQSQVAVLLYMCRGNVSTERLLLAQKANDNDSAQKSFAAAESDYMSALKLQPDNSDTWVQMCGLYEANKEAARAKAIYTRLLDTLSTTAILLPVSAVPLLNNLALLLMNDQQHEAAAEMLTMAKAVLEPLVPSVEATSSPPSPSSPAPAAPSLLTSGATSLVSSLSTQLASVLVNLSHCQQTLGDLDGALHTLQFARRLRPAHPSTLAGLGSVYSQLGQWAEAEAAMDEAGAAVELESTKAIGADQVQRNKRMLARLKEISQSQP